MELFKKTASELSELLAKKEISAVELAKENGIELEELRTTLDVLYQEEDV